MLGTRTIVLLGLLIGVVLELGIGAWTGRREAWDSEQYWIVGLPIAAALAIVIGFLARGRSWVWAFTIVPGQVATMMLRSGEIGNLWPLAVMLSGILGAPFVVLSFIGSRLRAKG
jgi:hypothetical protein